MKKILSALLTAAILLTVSGCGENTAPDSIWHQDDTASQGDNASEQLSDIAEPVSNSKLSIAFNGDNQAVITIKDEGVRELIKATDCDTTFEIYFYGDNEESFNLNIHFEVNSNEVYGVFAKFAGDEQPPEWYFDASGENAVVSDDLLTLTFNAVGVCSTIKAENAKTYSMLFFDSAEHNWDTAMRESGNVADIISSGESTEQAMKISYLTNDYARLEITNSQIVDYYKSERDYYDMRILLYSSEDNLDDDRAAYELCPTLQEYGYTTIYELEYLEEDGHRNIYPTALTKNEDGYDDPEIGKTIIKDNALLMKYEYNNIKDILSEMVYYKIVYWENDRDTVAEVGKLADCYTEYSYNITPVPEQLSTSSADDIYFTPTTDNYKLLEITFEDYEFALAGWYERMGSWVYGATEEYFDEDVKLVYLLSFDDFGEVLDAKLKIVYESENGQISDIFMNYPYYIIASELSGVNKADDSLITSELLESCDKAVFDITEYVGKPIEYLGHYDNARYYNIELDYDTLPTVAGWRFYIGVEYTDFLYNSNGVYEGTWPAPNDRVYPIRTYSSK